MKWEYKMERLTFSMGSGDESEDAVRTLNSLGGKGWEAVSMWDGSMGTYVLMKRQIAN